VRDRQPRQRSQRAFAVSPKCIGSRANSKEPVFRGATARQKMPRVGSKPFRLAISKS
jgi:hypothetical protein